MKVLIALEDGTTAHFCFGDSAEVKSGLNLGGREFFRVWDESTKHNAWFNSAYVIAIVSDEQEIRASGDAPSGST